MAERILVVDDEENVALTLAALLDQSGYRATTATTVADAAARLDVDRFDAILLDLMLGGDDGLQVLAHLRESAPDTAAIVLTGYGTLPSATRAMQLGVTEYLTKPCPIDELKAAVARSLERRRAILGAHRVVEEATSRQEFLASASALLASSLDEAAILDALVRLAVPTLGDWCVVDLLDEGHGLRRAAVTCADPAKEPLTREFLAGYPPDPEQEGSIGIVIQGGRSVHVAPIDDDLLRWTARDAREYEILHALGVRAFLSVPLAVPDRVLGALSVVSASPDRRCSPAEVALVEDLGRRVALAIDHARLFRAERRARERAEALQSLTAALAPRRSADEIARLMIERAIRVLGANRGRSASSTTPVRRSRCCASAGIPTRRRFARCCATGSASRSRPRTPGARPCSNGKRSSPGRRRSGRADTRRSWRRKKRWSSRRRRHCRCWSTGAPGASSGSASRERGTSHRRTRDSCSPWPSSAPRPSSGRGCTTRRAPPVVAWPSSPRPPTPSPRPVSTRRRSSTRSPDG